MAPVRPDHGQQHNQNANQHRQTVYSEQREETIDVRLDISDSSGGQQMPTEGSSSSNLREHGRTSELAACIDSEESVVLHVEAH